MVIQATNLSAVSTDVVEAEQALLAGMALCNETIDEVASIIGPDDFFRPDHQAVYRVILELHGRGTPVDIVLLHDELSRRNTIKDVETLHRYIGECVDQCPTAANAAHYARIVKDRSTRRQLLAAGNDVVQHATDLGCSTAELVAAAQNHIMQVGLDSSQRHARSITEIIPEMFAAIDARHAGDGCSKLLTGFTDIDELTGGLHNSELILIAARPSIGKTTNSVNFARTIVTEFGKPVLIYSLEQPDVELVERIFCAVATVDGHRMRAGRLNDDDVKKLYDAKERLWGLPLYILDRPGSTVSQIAVETRRAKAKQGISLLIVDYLQLIESERDDRRNDRHIQVATHSRRLKALARELKIPVIVLAQLNRKAEDSERPQLHHLRESGSLEQDADVVMLLSRSEKEDNVIIVEIAKQRNGRTGEVKLTFRKPFLRFENYVPENAAPF